MPELPYSSSLTKTEWLCTLVTVQKTSSSTSGKPCFLRRAIQSSTSRTLALSFDLPPVGSARGLLQTRQATWLEILPKITCSFLHLGQRTLTNFEVGSLIFTMKTSPERMKEQGV